MALFIGIAHYAALALTLASLSLMPSRPSWGGQDPVCSFSCTGICGPGGQAALFSPGLSHSRSTMASCPVHSQVLWRWQESPILPSAHTLWLGSVPAYPGIMPSL